MLLLEETGQTSQRVSLYCFYNCMWIYNYLDKIFSLKKPVSHMCLGLFLVFLFLLGGSRNPGAPYHCRAGVGVLTPHVFSAGQEAGLQGRRDCRAGDGGSSHYWLAGRKIPGPYWSSLTSLWWGHWASLLQRWGPPLSLCRHEWG